MPELTEEQAARWSIAQDTQLCFGSEVGQRVLAQLDRDFAARSSFHPEPLAMAFAEGERHVILTIRARLAMRIQDFVISRSTEETDAE